MTTQKFKPKSGFWKEEHGKVFWAETDKYGNVLQELIDPLNIEGISKTAQFNIVFVTENNDVNTLRGKIKKFWKQKVDVKLSEIVGQNVYIKNVDRKIFVCNLEPLGQTFLCPLESQDWGLIVSKSEPETIEQIEAKQLLDEGALGFGKVTITQSGIEYYPHGLISMENSQFYFLFYKVIELEKKVDALTEENHRIKMSL